METLEQKKTNIPQKNQQSKECCPTFYPEKWDRKTFQWNHKPFIKASVPAMFHIPFQKMLGKKITKMMQQVEAAHKMDENMENVLLLFNDPHAFKSDMYLSVIDEVPEAKNTTISGTFIAKVYDGPYKAIPRFMKDMNTYLKEQNKKARAYYIHYAYCPKCAEEKAHNYMILFAKV